MGKFKEEMKELIQTKLDEKYNDLMAKISLEGEKKEKELKEMYENTVKKLDSLSTLAQKEENLKIQNFDQLPKKIPSPVLEIPLFQRENVDDENVEVFQEAMQYCAIKVNVVDTLPPESKVAFLMINSPTMRIDDKIVNQFQNLNKKVDVILVAVSFSTKRPKVNVQSIHSGIGFVNNGINPKPIFVNLCQDMTKKTLLVEQVQEDVELCANLLKKYYSKLKVPSTTLAEISPKDSKNNKMEGNGHQQTMLNEDVNEEGNAIDPNAANKGSQDTTNQDTANQGTANPDTANQDTANQDTNQGTANPDTANQGTASVTKQKRMPHTRENTSDVD